jgi:DNA-directed RNA polymerase subunit RPC12/RpoP
MKNKIYLPCPYCGSEILKKPYLERQQGEYSIICPYCITHRSEWAGADTIEKAVISWNTYMRENTRGVLYYAEILSELNEKLLLEAMEYNLETEDSLKEPAKKYRIKGWYAQKRLPFTGAAKRYANLRREPVSRREQDYCL